MINKSSLTNHIKLIKISGVKNIENQNPLFAKKIKSDTFFLKIFI
jgi:hypothetical protein